MAMSSNMLGCRSAGRGKTAWRQVSSVTEGWQEIPRATNARISRVSFEQIVLETTVAPVEAREPANAARAKMRLSSRMVSKDSSGSSEYLVTLDLRTVAPLFLGSAVDGLSLKTMREGFPQAPEDFPTFHLWIFAQRCHVDLNKMGIDSIRKDAAFCCNSGKRAFFKKESDPAGQFMD